MQTYDIRGKKAIKKRDIMEKREKIYRYVSVSYAVLQFALAVFILFCSFLPFREEKNFYQVFHSFFHSPLGAAEPVLFLIFPYIAALFAFLSIRWPAFSLGTLVFSAAFFLIVEFPRAIESAIDNFASPWIGSHMSAYHIGYDLMSYASHVLLLERVFVVYSLAVLAQRPRKGANSSLTG